MSGLTCGIPHDEVIAVLQEFGGIDDLQPYALAATVAALRAELSTRDDDRKWRVLWEQERWQTLNIRRALRGWDHGRTLEDAVTQLLATHRAVCADHERLKAQLTTKVTSGETPLDDTWTTRT